MSVNTRTREAILDLTADYAYFIDTDRLEEWLEFFDEDSAYYIRARENVEQGLPVGIMSCPNKNSLRDRISILRNASKYNIHTDRHVLGPSRIKQDREFIHVTTPFSLFQTNVDGESKLLCVGCYDSKLIDTGDALKFRLQNVILDTSSVPTLIATPV